jgi:hypothetical protein
MSRILVVLLVITLAASSVAAQRPNTRDGFWISFGSGVGSMKLGGDVDIDRETSLSGYLRMGGTISPNFLIGAESNGWVKSNPSTRTLGFLGAVAMFYPSSTGSFYLKGGLGLVTVDYRGVGSGFGASIGLGNEFRVGKNFSLNVFVNAIQGFGIYTNLGNDLKPNWVQVGLGVTWH